MPTSPAQLKIAIAIATAGRRDVLRKTVDFLDGQRRRPDAVLICPARPEDVDREALAGSGVAVQVIEGPKGLPHQRNALMAASDADILVFLDDDFLPAADYLEEVERLFAAQPDIAMATGQVILDGATGPGIGFAEAIAALQADRRAERLRIRPVFNGYGCNMAIRMEPVSRHAIRFDENLPLYAWLEDVDFSRQLAAHGRIVKAESLRGVHLATKVGRTPGRRLGYSQIANRIYLHRKGSLTLGRTWDGILRNLAANLVGSVKPEPWVDRRGRLAGNFLAFRDLLAGRISPARILDL